MKTEAVNNNNNSHSYVLPMAKGAVAGIAGGYVVKYAQPLTSQELNDPRYKMLVSDINSRYTAYGPYTESLLDILKSKKQKTYAEDTFIKMFDGAQEGSHVKKGVIRDALIKTSKKGPAELEEFKRLCKDSLILPKEAVQKTLKLHKLLVKHLRPTAFFTVTGAVIGSMIALLNDILRTEIKTNK